MFGTEGSLARTF